MAEVLNSGRRFWAADKLLLAYLAGTSALVAVYWNRLPEAPELLTLHFGAGIAILLASTRGGRAIWYFRHWYPLPLLVSCYKEMAILISAVRGTTTDQWLADLDFSIWHANPTVWLERVQTPALTDFLQLAYTLYVPAVVLVPWLLWRKRRFADFRYCAFLITLGLLTSYIGYILVPARGPRFLLDHLQHLPVQGGWVVDVMRTTLDRLESVHYDCFPSGHVELTIIALWSSRQISKWLFRVYLAYTPCIIFATVYLRYHYTVDLVAGALLAATLIAAGPMMYRKLSGSEDSIAA
ncbi:MAG TPA: phosphatase PAP2 family protein [Candidatus Acidoferrum sp.]